MPRKTPVLLPLLQRIFEEIGENIRLARLRRRFSTELIAERAGMTRNTLRAIERGDPNVTFSAYARVLLCLGLENDLVTIARDDSLGRKLQDADLPMKIRAPKAVNRTADDRKKK